MRFGTLAEALRETVREAVRAELEPLLRPAAATIGAILEDDRTLREKIASLSAKVDKLEAVNTH